MTLNTSLRNWHGWLGVIISVPAIIVAITAIVLAHGQVLGIRNIPHNLGWLPGYQNSNQAQMTVKDLEVHSTLMARDGRYFLGTRYGLYQLQNHQLSPVEGLPSTDIRRIQETPEGLLVASRNGVWKNTGKHWKKIYKSDALEVEVLHNQVIRVATRNNGLLESSDGGRHWQPIKAINAMPVTLNADAKNEEMNLGRLAFDLHTGKAFFGKQWEWLWIDAIGLSFLFLVLSGLFLWQASSKQKSLLQG